MGHISALTYIVLGAKDVVSKCGKALDPLGLATYQSDTVVLPSLGFRAKAL